MFHGESSVCIEYERGVGKTTITVNLAYYLAVFEMKKVLVIDLDPQANVSSAFFDYEEYDNLLAQRKVVSEIFLKGTNNAV